MDNQDKLHQLKEMLRGEGWLQVEDLLTKFLTRKEQEKADQLRTEQFHKATLLQGKIDGVKELLVGTNSDLDKYLAILAKELVEEEPAY